MRKALVAGLLVAGGSTLLAQPGDPAAPDGAPGDGAVVTKKPTVKLTVAEMTERGGTLVVDARADHEHVLRLQLAARKEKDVIKLNCINDKLLQIKALLNILDTVKDDFTAALGAQDEDDRHHQYARLTMTAESVRQLKEEANACAGEGVSYFGESQVDWDGPDFPDDPTRDPFGDPIEDPAYASPFT